MASLKHLHSYQRSKYNKEIYRCTHPLCTHYTRRDMLVDKKCTCNKCGSITSARQEQLRSGQNQVGTKDITCLGCSKSIRKHEHIAIEDTISELFETASIEDKITAELDKESSPFGS